MAGVLFAFAVPVIRSDRGGGPDADPGLAEHFAHRFDHFRPASLYRFRVPSAGVTVGGLPGLRTSLTDRVAAGIMIVLIVGNAVGISLATWIVTRYTRANLDEGLSWTDGIGLSMLGGIGFTVSLLIGQLAFGFGTEPDNHVEVAVLVSPVIAAMLAALVLRARDRVDRRLQADDLDNRPEPTNVGPRADHEPLFARCVCRRIR